MASLTQLEREDYRFEITADGYFVWFGEQGLGGASVKLPREKPLHWRHRRANIISNTTSAILLAEGHKSAHSKE